MRLFLLFHINLSFSSIEESERKNLLKLSYWPLLKLIEKLRIPIGIEASAHTLEEIKKMDPKFIKKLKFLINKKHCEFIGSGYTQSIAPLIPAKVNDLNLKIGNDLYYKLLNIKPKVALINEQTFSNGILDNYLKNGYDNIIMDWENCFKSNKNIKNKYFFFPQKILTLSKRKINVIWSSSIFFQKFQRYVHGEIELSEYLKFIESKKQKFKKYNLCIYASDIEAINFRTNRFKYESKIVKNEWIRLEVLLKILSKKYNFISPSDVLKSNDKRFAYNLINFNNPAYPTITKKQSKYNILRWAVTGRDDNKINSTCWNIFNYFEKKNFKKYEYWKELCYLWSSDYRTHITHKRWKKYLLRLNNFIRKINLRTKVLNLKQTNTKSSKNILILNDKNKISICGKNIKLVLNIKKGCSIEEFYDYRVSKKFLFGFVPHGYYDDIGYGADFYSGHLVIEPLGEHKITDLVETKYKIEEFNNGIFINCKFKIDKGIIYKKIIFDNKNNKIGIKYKIQLKKNINGSIRINHITLNPKIFTKSLNYKTNNGGSKLEKFLVGNENFDHGQSVSHLITGNQAVGITENIIYLGNNSNNISIQIDRNFDNLIGMLSYKKIYKKRFFRLYFSVKEHDDTSKQKNNFNAETLTWISSNYTNKK